jgi:hypothetical protein
MLAVKARFDGKKVVLPEVPQHAAGAVIVVFTDQEIDKERDDWSDFSLRALDRAYGSDEPDYSKAVVKETNAKCGGEIVMAVKGFYDGNTVKLLEPVHSQANVSVIITFLEDDKLRSVSPTRLQDVAGCLRWTGPAKTLDDMEKAIEQGAKSG